MRRVAWPLFGLGASFGLVALLLGSGWLIGDDERGSSAAVSVRGWQVPKASEPYASISDERAPHAATEVATAPAPPSTPGEVRDVTPATVTPPPAVSGPLTRVAPPERPPVPPEPWQSVVFHRPSIASDLTLTARAPGRGGGRAAPIEIHLAGVTALAEDARCKDALGDEGPCRTVAVTALRTMIGARGIACQSPRRDIPSPLITTCRIGGRDLGAWLIERGYANGASPGPDQPNISANPG